MAVSRFVVGAGAAGAMESVGVSSVPTAAGIVASAVGTTKAANADMAKVPKDGSELLVICKARVQISHTVLLPNLDPARKMGPR